MVVPTGTEATDYRFGVSPFIRLLIDLAWAK